MSEPWISGHDEPDLEILSESALAMAQATIQNAMDEAKLSKADLARKIDRPRSYVTRILNGSHNLTVKTMARTLLACGYELQLGLTPIKWYWVRDAEPMICNTVPLPQEGTLVPAASGCWQ
jgi:hypothetical protein